MRPGQKVSFVVTGDDRAPLERVRLEFEDPESYDQDFYSGKVIDAAFTVLSPLGWSREEVRNEVRVVEKPGLEKFA